MAPRKITLAGKRVTVIPLDHNGPVHKYHLTKDLSEPGKTACGLVLPTENFYVWEPLDDSGLKPFAFTNIFLSQRYIAFMKPTFSSRACKTCQKIALLRVAKQEAFEDREEKC